jgi:alpha-ketoglutarate-dependent sulfate ester dioxygenase
VPEDHPSAIIVLPVSGWTGAEVHGVDISKPLSTENIHRIRAAVLRWKVVFFRGQRLDHAAHLRFARQFGEVTPAHPYEREGMLDGAYPEINTVSHSTLARSFGSKLSSAPGINGPLWHADATPVINPPAFSILRAEVVPQFGGDTQFSNTAAAYAGLSQPVQDLIAGLRAEHRFGASFGTSLDVPGRGGQGHRVRATLEHPIVSIHPVVRVHPETGERAIYVNMAFTSRIVDLTPRESRHILDLLFEQVTRPEYTARFRWEPGCVAMWDNRAVLHLPPHDHEHLAVERILHRVTVVGDVPVGPYGRSSESVCGEAFGPSGLTGSGLPLGTT